MHVIDPETYPLAPCAVYRPSAFSLNDAKRFESSLGFDNVVLVQPSFYGHDNSCLLDALRALGPEHARGVVSFDPKNTSTKQLQEWHAVGVRAVRFNMVSLGMTMSPRQLTSTLHQYADSIRPLKWALQMYVPMSLMELLETILPKLNVRVCIDHLGHPTLSDTLKSPYDLPGFRSLMRLLENGNTFVKLSAPYRVSQSANHMDVALMARELIRLKGTSRVVFGTDWPHTRFEGLDIRPWVDTVLSWCREDQVLLERLFKGNAEDLWDVQS